MTTFARLERSLKYYCIVCSERTNQNNSPCGYCGGVKFKLVSMIKKNVVDDSVKTLGEFIKKNGN